MSALSPARVQMSYLEAIPAISSRNLVLDMEKDLAGTSRTIGQDRAVAGLFDAASPALSGRRGCGCCRGHTV